MKRTLAVCAVAIWLAAVPASAQWGPTGPLFAVHEEIVKPSRLGEYEAANLDFKKLVVEHKAAMPHFSYLAFQGDDLTYLFLAPIPDLNGFTAIGGDFAALAQADATHFGDVFGRSNAAIESWSDYVIELDPALSYAPANPRVSLESTTFRHLDFYHLIPGKEADADALAREFLALYKAKNLPNPYHIYKGVLGGEMPTLIVVAPAKDAADYAMAERSDREALGEAGKALFARAFALTRRFESKTYVLRPELSVPPPAK